MSTQRIIVLTLLVCVVLAAMLLLWTPESAPSAGEVPSLPTLSTDASASKDGTIEHEEPATSPRTQIEAAASVARMLVITTVDTRGAAVSDVTITAQDPRKGEADSAPGITDALAVTDANGQARIDLSGLRFDQSGFARLKFAHCILSAPPSIVMRSSTELRVTFREGYRLVLRVVDEFDRPIAKARIEQEQKLDRGYNHRVIATWLTDAEGVVTIDHLQSGLLNLRIRAEGFGRKDIEIGGREGAPAERVVHLRRGAELIVTAVDPTGAAVAGVGLQTYDWGRLGSGCIWHGLSNEEGVATFNSLPRWLHEIHLIAKHPKFEKSEMNVALGGRQSTRVELHLKPASLLRVHVTDERGETPTGLLEVSGLDSAGTTQERYREALRIGADGIAILGGIPQGLAINLKVFQDRRVVAVQIGVEVGAGGEREIEIMIPATIETRFALTDANGRHLSGNVRLASAEGRKIRGLRPSGKVYEHVLGYAKHVELRAGEPIHIRPGKYHVTVYLDTGFWIEYPDITLLESQTVRLTIDVDSKRFGGRLTDGRGRPLGGEFLELGGFQGAGLTITKADGRFLFENLGDGMYLNNGLGTLLILDPIIGEVLLRSKVAPSPDIDLVYHRLPLKGTVRTFDEAGHRAAWIAAVSTAWSFGHGSDPRDYRPPMTDAEGRFQLRLPAGTYKLSARSENLASADVSTVLAEGAATPEVELVLFRQAWLKLGAEAAAGPATKLAVSVQGKTDHWSREYDLPVVARERSQWHTMVPAGKVAYRLLNTSGKLVRKGEILLRAGKTSALFR